MSAHRTASHFAASDPRRNGTAVRPGGASERDDDALPALPPLDDDGELLGDAVPDELVHEDRLDLDDAEAGDQAAGAFADDALDAEERDDGFGLEDEESDVDVDAASELVAGDERGLLEGSDEGDGRDVEADEAGLFDDRDSSVEDGGAEGTGEDPAVGLDERDEAMIASVLAEEDESDDLPFDEAALLAEGSREWPTTADVTWTIEPVGGDAPRASAESRAPSRDLVVDRAQGELVVSLDGGARFRKVDGCASATAVATLAGATHDRVAVVALYDAGRDVAAIAVVRAPELGPASAEIVAEIAPRRASAADDEEELARVDALVVESSSGEIVVVASGPFGRVRVRGR